MIKFTDDELKLLKEGEINCPSMGYCHIEEIIPALLARLEAAEWKASFASHTHTGLYCDCDFEQANEAWRKVSGAI